MSERREFYNNLSCNLLLLVVKMLYFSFLTLYELINVITNAFIFFSQSSLAFNNTFLERLIGSRYWTANTNCVFWKE